MRYFTLNRLLIIAGAAALILLVVFLFWWNKEIVVSKTSTGIIKKEGLKSSISGLECDNAGQRPIAVMLAGDFEARPLSALEEADMVFEMPVAPNGITRFMAVFQCSQPEEIGSVRSSREGFIPLAAGLKSIYAHWGGEHGALEKLNNGVINNVDALKYEGTIYYRKKGAKAPHNGFTNFDLLINAAKSLSYNLDDEFEGYLHTEKVKDKKISNLASSITVNYLEPFGVRWTYNGKVNIYKRERNAKPEIDKLTNKQISASVVVLMKTKSKFIRDQYINVDVQGEGSTKIYQGGIVIDGKWKKDPSKLDSKLTFYDLNGKEIEFLPGKIWIEIVSGSDQ